MCQHSLEARRGALRMGIMRKVKEAVGSEPEEQGERAMERGRIAGQAPLRDEMRPEGAEPVRQRGALREGGDERDTAGEHGPMAPESARGIPREDER
jgi:hypothetical protein